MAEGIPSLPDPLGSVAPADDPRVTDPRLHLEAYRTRAASWADPVHPADFFAGHPQLSSVVPGDPRRSEARGWMWMVNLLIGLALIALIFSHDWKLGRWFRPVELTRRVVLSPEPVARPAGRVSALTRARIESLDESLDRRDWERASQQAHQLLSDPVSVAEIRKDPAAWLWLGDVAVAAPVNAGDSLDGDARRQHYWEATNRHQEWVATGVLPGLLASYANVIARFYLQGGPAVPDTALSAAELREAGALLNTLGDLRNRFGPELEQSPVMRDRMVLVEGWTLARRLAESGRNPLLSRFDRKIPDNAHRWQRLSDLLDLGRQRLATERDYLRLDLHFWEMADSFCFNPLSANETVHIGGWSTSESEIEGRISVLRAGLGLRP